MSLDMILEYANLGMQTLGWVCVAVSVIVQVTPTKSDDKVLAKVLKYVNWVMQKLPYFGDDKEMVALKAKLKELESKLPTGEVKLQADEKSQQ
jgi:hypothetical protein